MTSGYVLQKADAFAVPQPEKRRTVYVWVDDQTTTAEHYAMWTCEMEPQSTIAMAAHLNEDELMFVYRGSGEAVVDGVAYPIEAETTIYVPIGVEHELRNTAADEPLCFVWVHAPPGREKALRAMAAGR